MAGSRTGPAGLYTHTVLVQAITFVLRPTAIYQAIELDVPAQWLGAIGASFALVPLALAVPSGQAVDRFGERRTMVVGSALTLVATACFLLLGGSVWGILVASVALGMGHLCSVVGQQALVANRTPRARYDTAFGHYTFAASSGQALGPLLIIVFGGSTTIPDTRSIVLWTFVLAVALISVSVLLPKPLSSSTGATARDGSVRQLLRRPGLVRALTVSCVVLAAVDISIVYLPALGAERGIAASTIGLLLTVRAISSMTSRFFLGRLAAWFGRARLLTGSVALSAIGMALLPLPVPVWLMVSLVAVAGLGLGAGQPLTMSWLAEATSPGLRGRAMSLRLTGNRLGQVVVPTTAGLVAASSGAAGVLWLTAASLAAVGFFAKGLRPS